jgi:hypothetical protein
MLVSYRCGPHVDGCPSGYIREECDATAACTPTCPPYGSLDRVRGAVGRRSSFGRFDSEDEDTDAAYRHVVAHIDRGRDDLS